MYYHCAKIAKATSKEDVRAAAYQWNSLASFNAGRNLAKILERATLDQWKKIYLIHMIGYDIINMVMSSIADHCVIINDMYVLLKIANSDTLPLEPEYDDPSQDDIRETLSFFMDNQEDVDTTIACYNYEPDDGYTVYDVPTYDHSTRIISMVAKIMDESLGPVRG